MHGVQQADRLATRFAEVPLDAIYSSELARAHGTALAVLTGHRLNPDNTLSVAVDTRLRERNFGWREDTVFGATTARPHAAALYDSTLSKDERRQLLRAQEGESAVDVSRRAKSFLKTLVARHLVCPTCVDANQNTSSSSASSSAAACSFSPESSTSPNKKRKASQTVLVVTHGAYIGALLDRIESGFEWSSREDKPDLTRTGHHRNTAVTTVEIRCPHQPERRPRYSFLSIADFSHLEGLDRQKGIGVLPFDPAQKTMTNYFSGPSSAL